MENLAPGKESTSAVRKSASSPDHHAQQCSVRSQLKSKPTEDADRVALSNHLGCDVVCERPALLPTEW